MAIMSGKRTRVFLVKKGQAIVGSTVRDAVDGYSLSLWVARGRSRCNLLRCLRSLGAEPDRRLRLVVATTDPGKPPGHII
jgi:hypothetical protein